MPETKEWYKIEDADKIDTPTLVVYPERIKGNIERMIAIAGNADRLYPHVKTHKMEAVVKIQITQGITKFKCATIAEAEMLAQAEASDVLLAYPLIRPKIQRFNQLIEKYSKTRFSALIDSIDGAKQIAEKSMKKQHLIQVWIDINVGMHRTGINIENLTTFYEDVSNLKGLEIVGLHVYDGHISDSDKNTRFEKAKAVFEPVIHLKHQLEKVKNTTLKIVAGGTGTFPFYATYNDVWFSPGTCLLWDEGYRKKFPDLKFDFGALLLARVISKPQKDTICIDLGYKAVAAENPLPRVSFLNLSDATVLFQSEEHMVLSTKENLDIGTLLYAVPIHICPSCALYDDAFVIENHHLSGKWAITARKRSINI
ncbi:MAG: D-TA family PLP-dependent enzyme [Bacteroidota bacterium]